MLSSGTQMTMPVAPVSGTDGFFGGNNGWWIILLFLFIFAGWGGNGFGGNTGAAENYVLASDFATLQRQIDTATQGTQNLITNNSDALQRQIVSIGNGISSLGYDQLNQFNGVNKTVMQSTYDISTQLNNIAANQQSCCCATQRSIDGVNYNLATQANGITNAMQTGFCQTNYNNQTNTRDIIDGQNANTRAILDKLCAMESNAKDERIAQLTAMNADLRLQASQVAQNSYLVSQLGTKAPVYCNCGCNCGCN